MKRGAKRFYKDVAVSESAEGFSLLLDGKAVKTPAGAALRLDGRALAEAIAEEWRGQGDIIEPDAMPLTRYANTVIDRIGRHRAQIDAELAKFAEHDLLCYREATTTELMRRQAAAWDPWLAWVADRYGADLAVAQGVVHVDQPAEAIERIAQAVGALDAHRVAVLHTGVSITGSAVLGLAFVNRALDAVAAFSASRVDQVYQAELWGNDAEADARAARLLADLQAAERYLSLLPPV